MRCLVHQVPVQAPVRVPLARLGEFLAHEQEFLAGMGPHEGVIGSQIGEAGPVVARHAAEDGAFAVHDLVMRQRQHEVFGEGVDETEGHFVVVVAAMDGIERHVVERIVHPAHVPFETEPEAAFGNGMGDAAPGRRFLGDRQGVRADIAECFVESFQEGDGVAVVVGPVLVGRPGAGFPGIVEVEH